jgi:hypothetical protein
MVRLTRRNIPLQRIKIWRDECASHREFRAMYQRKSVVSVVALSVDGMAEALSLPRRRILRAIAAGELAAYCEGPGKPVRVIIADAIEWIKTWPRANRSPQ